MKIELNLRGCTPTLTINGMSVKLENSARDLDQLEAKNSEVIALVYLPIGITDKLVRIKQRRQKIWDKKMQGGKI